MTETIQSPLLNLKEAACYLHVAPDTLRMWKRERRISCYKMGSLLMFKKEDLDEFIEAGYRPAEGQK